MGSLVTDDLNYVLNMVQETLGMRRQTIDFLRLKAEQADVIHQNCASSSRNANLTGVVGGMFAMAAGGVAIVTSGGAAAPLVVGSLSASGTALSIGGGAWSIKNDYTRSQNMAALEEEIREVLARDEEAVRECQDIFARIEGGDFGEPMRMNFGSDAAVMSLNAVLPTVAAYTHSTTVASASGFALILSNVSADSTIRGVNEIVGQSTNSAVMLMRKGFSKGIARGEAVKAAEATRKLCKESLGEAVEVGVQRVVTRSCAKGGGVVVQHSARVSVKRVTRNVVEEAAVQAGKTGIASQMRKEAAGKAMKKAARRATEEAASKAAGETAKTAARVTGAISAGFGAVSSLWEGYNAYHNHCASYEKTELGRELRRLADFFEGRLHTQVELYRIL